MQDIVTWVAIVLALASFATYLWITAVTMPAIRKAADAAAAQPGNADKPGFAAGADLGTVLGALKDIVATLAKAGPAFAAIICSVLFLLIAAANVGAFKAPEPKAAPPCTDPDPAKCKKDDTQKANPDTTKKDKP